MIFLNDYRRSEDGSNWTPAFNRALIAAAPLGQAIRFPAGRLHFMSPPNPMGCGIYLEGEGGITSAKTGTCCIAAYEEIEPERGFFEWDGGDPRGYSGTGGGIRGMTLYKIGGPKGGTAIKLRCINATEYRAGWWSLDNVAAISEAGSVWDHCFVADGRAVPRQGIRYLSLKGFMASGARNHVIDLRNVFHFKWVIGEVQSGPTQDPHTPPAGIRITGPDSQNIHISGVGIWDTLDIQECHSFKIDGLVKWVRIAGEGKVRRGFVEVYGCDSMDDSTSPADMVHVRAV